MPGPTMASPAVMTALAATATTRLGARANTAARTEAAREIHDEELQDPAGLGQHELRGHPGPDDQADELERLDGGGHRAAAHLVEAELLLVEERGQGHEADERRGQERQGVPDAPEAGDLPAHAPRLGEARAAPPRCRRSPRRRPWPRAPVAPHRLPHLQAEDDQDHRGDGEHEERAPASRTSTPGGRRAAGRGTGPRRWPPGGRSRRAAGCRAGSSRPAASCGSDRPPPCRCPSRPGPPPAGRPWTPGRSSPRRSPRPPRPPGRRAPAWGGRRTGRWGSAAAGPRRRPRRSG